MNILNTFSIFFNFSGVCKYITPTYSLPAYNNADKTLVALPSAQGNIPVTFGSKVPPCPALSIPKILRAQETTSWLVGPLGLFKFITPYFKRASMSLLSGSHPYSSLVVSWDLTINCSGSSDGNLNSISTIFLAVRELIRFNDLPLYLPLMHTRLIISCKTFLLKINFNSAFTKSKILAGHVGISHPIFSNEHIEPTTFRLKACCATCLR
ncbi:hypothetical protein ES705_42030 [subsurface metagenome]